MRTAMLIVATAAAAATITPAAAESRTFQLDGFDRLDIATGLDAVVTVGNGFSVTAESQSSAALDNLELQSDGGVLTARIEQNFLDFIVNGGLVGMLLSSGNAVTLTITVPSLAAVTASSGADVELHQVAGQSLALDASSGANIALTGATLAHLSATASSGSDIDLEGDANRVELSVSSGADIDAEALRGAEVIADASSGGDLSVHATQSIRANASSGADIEIFGNPTQQEIDSSSGGDIHFED